MRSKCIFFLLVTLLTSLSAGASVVLNGTRIIYEEGFRDVSINVTSENKTPALLQIWTDAGDQGLSPSDFKTPFTVLNPIFRLDAGRSQVIRLVMTDGSKLPVDRESIFWLNVLEIPTLDKVNADVNRMQIAIRQRIKILYRPAALKSYKKSPVDDLSYRIDKATGKASIVFENKSPLSIAVAKLIVKNKEDSRLSTILGQTVGPFASGVVSLNNIKVGALNDFQVAIVNDYGGIDVYKSLPNGNFEKVKE